MKFIVILLLFSAMISLSLKQQPPPPQAKVKFLVGKVEKQPRGVIKWTPLKFNTAVFEGDRIKTGLNSRVELDMPDGTIMKINENTIFDVTELKTPERDQEDKMRFTVWIGNIWAKFKKVVTGRQDRYIESPSAVVAIRGTTIEMDVDLQQKTLVRVEEGLVSVKSKDVEGEVMVGSNQETIVEKGKAPTAPKSTSPGQGEEGKDDQKAFNFRVDLDKFVFTDPAVLTTGIHVRGKLPAGARLFADGQPIPVQPGGHFEGFIRVKEGLNRINMEAELNGERRSKKVNVFVNTIKPEIRLSTPLIAGFYNRRDYSLSGGVFDLTPGDKIKVFINSEEVTEVSGRGSFNRTIILKEGPNTIRVTAKDRSGNTFEISQRLFLDTVKPILTITEPAQPVHFIYEPPPPPRSGRTRLEQVVRGIIIDPEPSSKIKRVVINGKEVQPNSDGTFETRVYVERGTNRLNFYVEDLAGNILRDNSRVIRVP